jgi:hypothetical protein
LTAKAVCNIRKFKEEYMVFVFIAVGLVGCGGEDKEEPISYFPPVVIPETNTVIPSITADTFEVPTTPEADDNRPSVTINEIEGKWKNVGENTFAMAQKGAIIVFDGTNCNWYSPSDTYAFYKDGDDYRLDITSLIGESRSFVVKVIDNDNIEIYFGDTPITMQRVD